MRYIGVREQDGRYRARISMYYKIICLGSYGTPEEAARVRDKYVVENNLNRELNFNERYIPKIR